MTRAKFIVGICILIWRDEKLLVGKRLGGHGAGEWSCPGGCLEQGETIAAAVAREVLEETGLTCTASTTIDAYEWEDEPTGITIVVEAQCKGEPYNLEPDRCEGWHWIAPEAMPQPQYDSLRRYLGRRQNRP